MQIKWKEQQSTIVGFGVILLVLGVFSYIIWNTGKSSMNEMVIEEVPLGESPSSEISTPIVEEKSKVRIYTEESKLDENGYDFDVKVLRTINNGAPELLTTIELRDTNFADFLPYSINLSPDRENILLSYETLDSDILQLFNIETKETRDIFIAKSGFNVSYSTFSPNSKEVFFLKSNNRDKTYDFYLYNSEIQKNEIIKTVRTSSEIFSPRWLPDNQILLTYSPETTIESPLFRQEFYIFNKNNNTILTSPNQKLSLPSAGEDLFNTDNSLFIKPQGFTTKTFKTCDGDEISIDIPNSYRILETLSGKEIASFKGNQEPIDPISFSPDNTEILYRLDLADNGCFIINDRNKSKYYVQSLYDNRPREEVNLDNIIKKWDISLRRSIFGQTEIIFYQ